MVSMVLLVDDSVSFRPDVCVVARRTVVHRLAHRTAAGQDVWRAGAAGTRVHTELAMAE